MDSALGQILVQSQLVPHDRIRYALERQRQNVEKRQWQRLGEILLEAGDITPQDLVAALDRQAQLHEIEYFSLQTHPSVHSRFKRLLDVFGSAVGCIILIFFLPIISIAILLDSPGSVFITQYRVGLRGKQFRIFKFRTAVADAERTKWKISTPREISLHGDRYGSQVTRVGSFLRATHLDELPQFVNVLAGDMSLVGTRPPTLDEVQAYSSDDWQRLSIKPGMTGLWQTSGHQRKFDFERVKSLDMAYIQRWTIRLDFRIIFRTIAQFFLGYRINLSNSTETKSFQTKVPMLSIEIDNLSREQLLNELDEGVVFTPNVDHLMKLQRDFEFYKVYRKADYKICDSQILLYASHFLGTPIQEKISGSDFFPAFCEFHKNNHSMTVFLLGGAEGVPQEAQARINRHLGRDIIVAAHSPSFGFVENHQECWEIVERINRIEPTVLAVGVGAPSQEKWIDRYREHLPSVKIFLAIGATIDFEAGHKGRSPQWASNMGLEWFHRLITEPRRLWRRYLIDDLPFFGLILKQRLGFYISPWATFERLSRQSLQTFEKDPSK